MRTRNPSHQLHAIALLAYLGADDDGPVSIDADPDPERASLRLRLLGISDDAQGPLLSDPESALALVSAALDLLDAAQVDARRGPAIDVERRFGKVRKHLDEIVAQLEPSVRLDALEAEVARLRHGLSQEAAEEAPEVVRYDEARAAAPRIVEPADLDVADRAGELPVGTITISGQTVFARRAKGWDLSGNLGGSVYYPTPDSMFDPKDGDGRQVIVLGDGAEPPSWARSNEPVMEAVRAWLAERSPQPVPVPDGAVPELESLDPSDDDGSPL